MLQHRTRAHHDLVRPDRFDMVRLTPFAAVALMCVTLAHASEPHTRPRPDTLDPALRTELAQMRTDDQAVRDRMVTLYRKYGGAMPKDAEDVLELREQMKEIDTRNTARLKAIIARHGWPGRSSAGAEAADAAWLIAQHADHDPAFQAEVLTMIQPFVDRGEVAKSDYAMLTDRVLIAEHKRQRYGTQCVSIEIDGRQHFGPSPVEDPADLDARRRDAGLPPLDAYLTAIRKMMGIAADTPMIPLTMDLAELERLKK